MSSIVWGRRRKGERELRENNGRRLVGAGDIYDGQLFLHVVENRPRRRPIFFLRPDVCSLALLGKKETVVYTNQTCSTASNFFFYKTTRCMLVRYYGLIT
jgi:hypothetical protein